MAVKSTSALHSNASDNSILNGNLTTLFLNRLSGKVFFFSHLNSKISLLPSPLKHPVYNVKVQKPQWVNSAPGCEERALHVEYHSAKVIKRRTHLHMVQKDLPRFQIEVTHCSVAGVPSIGLGVALFHSYNSCQICPAV